MIPTTSPAAASLASLSPATQVTVATSVIAAPVADAYNGVNRREKTEENRFENLYPLVNVHITMENHHFQWVNQL